MGVDLDTPFREPLLAPVMVLVEVWNQVLIQAQALGQAPLDLGMGRPGLNLALGRTIGQIGQGQ